MTPLTPRERLATVALELFSRHGYDGVSVRALTRKARVNLGAVTYHFGSKRGLYHAALERMAGPFHARIAAAAASPGAPLDRVEAVVRAAIAHLTEHGEAPKCLLRELASDRPVPPPLADLMRRNIGALRTVIADGQRDGSIRSGDPVLLAFSVVSQPFFFKIASRPIGQLLAGSDQGAAWEHTVNHVVESVRRSIATSSQDSP